ncbi:16S rRNA (adenine(1518)-N(6)/adenine(1519)-N(6))-dimethyltransferase RsmA [Desulfogranum mediterraneum]|uniref:16S rRNA (adenine(1518)-N(6)/adenine(1519)-N(6))- dimethyltransferase RsmA n=1 Tax=Desulfogranum mediterraneum TaxID=160661 RepID=UPI0004907A14|nr:16S rRNA (adenine(1518)-N(6)/adenine(1519)-N(6))-dimethyltransferase RsmA [Desulfogranum mediterraneum]
MTYQQTKSTLKKEGLAPSKKLGQNFLVHEHTAQRIVNAAGVEAGDTIIEVGVGLGALTYCLARQAARVIGIEADSGLIRMHQEQQQLPETVELRHGDILKTDLTALARETGEKLKIVANLPYSISSPFLFQLIAHRQAMASAVVMLQKEVAERLLAQPGTKAYGAPTVLLAACAAVEPLLKVKPAEFHPKPKVDSLVIRITFDPQPERVRQLEEYNPQLFRRVVNAAFGQRRKTLLNALSSAILGEDKERLAGLIQQAGLDPRIRAEKLAVEDFIRLSRIIEPALS